MAKKEKEQLEQNLESVESALTRTERYIEENQKIITIVILAVIVVVGGYLLYNKYYIGGREKSAQTEMYAAQRYFQTDSFKQVLQGDGINPGMLYIIDEYGNTTAGNLANYYAGISYLHMGEYQNAISYLQDFDKEGYNVAPIATGAIGDAYLELGEAGKALEYYTEATKVSEDNSFTNPIYLKKAAHVYEIQGDYAKAQELYETIQKQYPNSREARDIQVYIENAKLKAEQ